MHKSESAELRWHEKALMKYHYFICKLCQQYTEENKTLNEILMHHKNAFLFSEEEVKQYKEELLIKLNI